MKTVTCNILNVYQISLNNDVKLVHRLHIFFNIWKSVSDLTKLQNYVCQNLSEQVCISITIRLHCLLDKMRESLKTDFPSHVVDVEFAKR
jgi:hypothetical protein